MFDEMALVVGKDRAKGNFAKSFGDINLESRPQLESIPVNLDEDIDLEEVPKEKEGGKQASSSSTTSSQSRQHRKRNRTTYTEDESLVKISDRLGDVAVALGKLTEDRLVVSNLYEEVMKTEDFDEEFLASAFDYLVQNEMLAKAFLAKNNRLRKIWLENFRKQ